MARKSMKQIAESTIVPDSYDITLSELQELVFSTQSNGLFNANNTYEAICTAFKYGFALGGRCEKRKAKVKVSNGN